MDDQYAGVSKRLTTLGVVAPSKFVLDGLNWCLRMPWRCALGFAVLACGSTLSCAAYQERLFDAEDGVQPFILNASTIIDFFLLNPLMIAGMARSVQAMRNLHIQLPLGRAGLAAIVLSMLTIIKYVRSLIDGNFFDALVIGPTVGNITLTGWVVFFWTGLALTFCYFGVIAQFVYLYWTLHLSRSTVKYEPLHEDGCAGLRRYAEPCWSFLNVMVVVLLVFVMFYIQDHVINKQLGSSRMPLFVLYLALTPALFLPPVLHLRRLMLEARGQMIAQVQCQFAALADSLPCPATGDKPPGEVGKQLAALIEIRKQIASFPAWPLPLPQLVQSAVYWVGPLIPMLPKASWLLDKFFSRESQVQNLL